MAPSAGHPLLVIERILRDRESIWRQVISERGLRELTLAMLASSAVSFALYGAVLGASNGPAQALSSAVKLPLLFLATLAICLPTLYLFNLLFGARLSMMQAVSLIMVSVTVTAVLTLAFAPISLFFLISAHSYSFFKVLNVAILVLTAIVGLRFLTSGMASLNASQERAALEVPALVEEPVPALVGAPANGATAVTTPLRTVSHPATTVGVPAGRPASMMLLYIWIALFGFVGTQLGWTLRPFFGSPGKPFAIFRTIDGTFYGDIFATIGRLFG
jgi:hypothetical protein